MAVSGTSTPSSSTSCEPVPRMPSVCQFDSTRTPGDFIGSAKCSTVGPVSGSSWTAQVMNRSAAGAPLAKILRASTRKPPSTRVALPLPCSQSDPPLPSNTSCSPATRLSSPSTGAC
jgi:hypothetical protein